MGVGSGCCQGNGHRSSRSSLNSTSEGLLGADDVLCQTVHGGGGRRGVHFDSPTETSQNKGVNSSAGKWKDSGQTETPAAQGGTRASPVPLHALTPHSDLYFPCPVPQKEKPQIGFMTLEDTSSQR